MKNLFILLLMFHSVQGLAIVTLGTDQACDYDAENTSIQSLIDDQILEIRVTNQKEFVENLYIPYSTRLKGGYTNCTEAEEDNPTDLTIINGNGIYSVVTATSTDDTRSNISLSHFNLKNGFGADVAHGGGITAFQSNETGVTLNLVGVTINENDAYFGGGLYVSGQYTWVNLFDTMIHNNEASLNGGGIYCNDSSIFIYEGSGVSLNKAISNNHGSGHGGGIFATNYCNITIETGASGGLLDYKGISSNKASGHGGGIYTDNGSAISAISNSKPYPVNINYNVADWDQDGIGHGGGIYAKDDNTGVFLQGTTISHNTADSGGGMAIFDNAKLHTSLGYLGKCWNRYQCNIISNNSTSTTGGKGGAIFASAGEIKIKNTHISENNADAGSVIDASNASRINVSHTKIYKNGQGGTNFWDDLYTYRVLNSELEMLHITSADNHSSQTTFHLINAEYDINHSIFHSPETSHFADNTASTGHFNCIVTNDDTGLQNTTQVLIGDPNFVERNLDDYHLASGSLAIDLCSNELDGDNLDFWDMDGEPTAWDDPNQLDILGTVDAGADESYASDVIFHSTFD